MRTLYFLKKTFLENLREWKILVMALVLAPFFVFLMWGYFIAADPVYRMLIANDDAGAADGMSKALIEAWRGAAHPDGKSVFRIEMTNDRRVALAQIQSRDVDLLVRIPKGFGEAMTHAGKAESQSLPRIVNHADPSNMRGGMAMALSDYTAFSFAFEATGMRAPIDVTLESVGKSETLSEFDLYIPALLVLAIIMVLFTAAATLIREVEKGTMTRLVLSRLSTAEMMVAVSINQVLIGLTALGLAIGAAYIVGYRPVGAILAILPVGAIGAMGVVAIGLICAAFLKTIFELLTVGVFPFFILMFFSECMFPLPKIHMVTLFGHTLYANDILPTSLTVRAFNQILNHGASLTDIPFELGALTILTAIYFALGMFFFKRRA